MKMKRFAALAAVMMLGIQLAGIPSAFAAKPHGSADADCDFGSSDLEITLGDTTSVGILVDKDGILQCDDTYAGSSFAGVDDPLPVAAVKSITVEMDHDDSLGKLYIILDDAAGSSADAVAEWPAFETFDINVTTKVIIDGSGVDGTSGRSSERVVITATSLSFSGTTATSSASSYEVTGGPAADVLDASKTKARVTLKGGGGNDLLKGGSGSDTLLGEAGVNIVYGNAGNDDIDCGTAATTGSQGWGGDGLDDIRDCRTAAPGADDDVIDGDATSVTYVDLTDGIEWDSTGASAALIVTGGAAGSDSFASWPTTLGGSSGDDLIVDAHATVVKGNAGDDFIWVSNVTTATSYASGGDGNDVITAEPSDSVANDFFGNAGDDILKSKGGNDMLRGGPGKDQAWGGSGMGDACFAEVTNRCELSRV